MNYGSQAVFSRALACGIAAALLAWIPSVEAAPKLRSSVVPAAPGLTAYFPLDEAPGSSTTPNAVAGGNTGTLENFADLNAAWVTDTPSQLTHSTRSLLFSGFDASIIRNNIAGSSPTQYIDSTQPFTLSTWFRLTNGALPDPNGSNLFPFVTTLTNDTPEAWGVFFGSSAFSTTYEGINFGSTSQWGRFVTTGVTDPELEDGDWHHLLVTFDGVDEDAASSFALYLDGTLEPITSQASGFANNVNDYMGSGDQARFNFDGNIDDFALFNELLSSEQIAFLAAGGSPLFTIPLAPEPGTLILFAVALSLLAGYVWRRRRLARAV